MAEQDPRLESEIGRLNAEANKLKAEALEIEKRVWQRWYQGRNAVLLIIQTLIAGIIGAGAFAYALFGVYDPYFEKKAEIDRMDVDIAERGVDIAERENKLQGVKLKEQETKLNEQEAELKEQRAKFNEQEAELKDQRAKFNEQEAELKDQRAKFKEQEAELKDQRAKFKEQEAELKDQRAKFNEQEAELKEQINDNNILKDAVNAREIKLDRQKEKANKAEDEARKARKENKIILAELMAIRAKDSIKTLSEKDLKSVERLERKTKELALKAVPPPRAMQVKRLRREPKTLGSDEIFKMVLEKGFSLPGHEIKGSFRHYYEARTLSGDQVVEDHATGLMWQQAGSAGTMTFEETKKYVADINARKFAGFDDWCLPTIEELISLVEPELQNWTLFLDGNFDETQRWIRSADQKGPNNSWGIVFYEGKLYLPTLNFPYYVRLVRSSTPC